MKIVYTMIRRGIYFMCLREISGQETRQSHKGSRYFSFSKINKLDRLYKHGKNDVDVKKVGR